MPVRSTATESASPVISSCNELRERIEASAFEAFHENVTLSAEAMTATDVSKIK
jgi:hypothetical protein